MVNKSRIYGEIWNFFRYSSNLIKSDEELSKKLKFLVNLERKLQEKSTESKIKKSKSEFESVFVEKLSEIYVENRLQRERKPIYFVKFCKKLKINVIRRKIRVKTHNLTRNDPIHCRIKAFHFAFQKIKIQCPRGKLSSFSQQNLTFTHSLDSRMSLENEES